MSAADPVDLPERTRREWRKSRRCDTASCVEVASAESGVWVRDETGSVLAFSGDAWRAFLAKACESKLTKVR
ncbi:DUF397 domain-containing protein [Catenuloplanes sp. NPDC051500]|uniref:DUF397 domain-containing protein n=1 Tax=Catenuloplanes sp. NPDC051500 TaxID=3363959 RepID=UPI0037ACA9BA